MADPHRLLGEAIVNLTTLQEGYARTMELLKRLKAGEVKIAEVELSGTGWKISESKRLPISSSVTRWTISGSASMPC